MITIIIVRPVAIGSVKEKYIPPMDNNAVASRRLEIKLIRRFVDSKDSENDLSLCE
jgi:hypothetical protein